MEIDNKKEHACNVWTVSDCYKSTKLGENCFLKGCKWSPDGLCLLTASEDCALRLFEPQINNLKLESSQNQKATLIFNEGETIYDYAWYPAMNSSDPGSCVFATSSHNSPVHLWDAYTGTLRATYQPINQVDEVANAFSLCFSPDGKLYCGMKKEIKIFQLHLPGRESEKRPLKNSDLPAYQNGIVSTIAFNPVVPSLYAVGSYDKSIGLYCEPDGSLLCLMQAHTGGITHLLFGPDGNKLYSGARQDNELFCWDLRKPGSVLFTIERVVQTQQRIYFDQTPDGRYLVTGSTNGFIEIFDVNGPVGENKYLPSVEKFQAHNDCVNGVSLHPQDSLLATASGQRHAVKPQFSDDEETDSEDEISVENSVKIWKFPQWMTTKETSVDSV